MSVLMESRSQRRRESMGRSRPGARLAQARAQHFPSAAKAARALGVPYPTYLCHENGWRRLDRYAERYARFFEVSFEWLLIGRGEMRRD
jgi:hypothetical protein